MFIASHSSILINEFIRLKDTASLYAFGIIKNEYIDPTKTPRRIDFKAYSSARKIQTNFLSILDTLGCKGSDLLQCNGVVWVEGPSDVIYIRKWLEMYAIENNFEPLRQGEHFEFQMYGGAILDSLCLIEEGLDANEEIRKLVSMFSFSRNAYIVTDSDAIIKDDIIVDKSKFSNAKLFIKRQVEKLNEDGYKLGLWYAENNTELKTIENYLDAQSLDVNGKTKKIAAQNRVNNWDNKTLDDFDDSLKNEIEKLYEKIESWQE